MVDMIMVKKGPPEEGLADFNWIAFEHRFNEESEARIWLNENVEHLLELGLYYEE